MAQTKTLNMRTLLPVSFLVAGNLMGIGVLAMPIKVGLSGFIPALIDILVVSMVMLFSAFVIAGRLPEGKKHFDIPSFFKQELGTTGYCIATICNLILLYGVLIAYLSAISSIIDHIFPLAFSESTITIVYFLLATSLIMFGRNALRRGSVVLLISIFICFIVLMKTGVADFNLHSLTYTNWKFLPWGLPVVVSAFHFHNIIPTVSKYVNYDQKSIRKTIIIGVGIGLVMNLIWTTIVMGSLPVSTGPDSILASFHAGLPATVPMTYLLHSKIFATAGLIFAGLAVTASYVANGTGLFGFIKDMTHTYLKTSNTLLVGALAFLIPLVITLIYPNIFLSAVDIVGGVGEAVLFIVLPGIILIKAYRDHSKPLLWSGCAMFSIGMFIFLFIVAQKFGIVHYNI